MFAFGLMTILLLSFLGTLVRQMKRHTRASESANHELARKIEERLKTEGELREARDYLELRVQQQTAEFTVINNQFSLQVAAPATFVVLLTG